MSPIRWTQMLATDYLRRPWQRQKASRPLEQDLTPSPEGGTPVCLLLAGAAVGGCAEKVRAVLTSLRCALHTPAAFFCSLTEFSCL